MPVSQTARIKSILESGNLEGFVGLLEDLHFEAKNCTPYDLGTEKGRYELAKDVSALANSEGGYIVIGLHDERVTDQRTDRVRGLDLFEEAALSVTQILGVIKEYVYPALKNLEIRWVASAADSARGLCYIHIPRQSEAKKLFIITSVFADSARQTGGVIGIARRVGADSTPMTAHDLYNLIRRGHDPQGQQLTRIEEKIDALSESRLSSRGPSIDQEVLLRKRMEDLLGEP